MQRIKWDGKPITTPRGLAWDESAYYGFTKEQIRTLEAVTKELSEMCGQAVNYIFEHPELFQGTYGVFDWMVPYLQQSWQDDSVNIIGRMDLWWDGEHPPALLEFDADIPTGIYEAAIAQVEWRKRAFPAAGQFNYIDESIFGAFEDIAEISGDQVFHFTSLEDDANSPDTQTIHYLMEAASEGGAIHNLKTNYIALPDIGWNPEDRTFRDLSDQPMYNIIKAGYGWHQLAADEFGRNIPESSVPVKWFEPAWKGLMANKAILVLLYEMFPDHPNILPAAFDESGMPTDSFVRKPQFGRNGDNITVFDQGKAIAETNRNSEPSPFIFQQLAPLPNFDGKFPVIESWLVNGEAAGICVREGGLITNSTARRVPHVILEKEGFFKGLFK